MIAAYALTIFLGAFLLFQIQPLIGKYILPWFGGGPEVWTTCMLFFQVLLLLGYAYAHASFRFLRPRVQVIVHLVMLLAALTALPITPDSAWGAGGDGANPTWGILLLLAGWIAVPYFVLASNSPLMQGWFSLSRGGAVPYRFFALSNAGSLLALVSYPLVFERFLSRTHQGLLWSAGLVGFAIASVICAVIMWRASKSANCPPARPEESETTPERVTAGRRLLWLGLPAGAAVVLLAATNKICLDLAAVPFLWVLPLGLYLLSFIICFDNPRWYVRKVFLAVFIISLVTVIYLRINESDFPIYPQIAVHLTALFASCMVSHGELYRLRPSPRFLTSYYLMIAAGGALGGFLVVVVAPLVFTTYLELHLGLLACCVLALLTDQNPAVRRRRLLWVSLIVLTGAAALVRQDGPPPPDARVVSRSRNFYGVLRLLEKYPGDVARRRYVLQHGTTIHGVQFTDPQRRRWGTAYYGPEGGAGLAMRAFPRKANRRFGLVGLGVGTLATYGQPGDVFRFYEINPAVERMARTRFSYLSDTPAEVQIVLGDARNSMEREEPQQFDMLFLDAFSSDAIPVHLLTLEAFETYLKHLKDDGVLAVHVSTHHLDVESVVLRLSEHFALEHALIITGGDESQGTLPSRWVLLTRNAEFMNSESIRSATSAPRGDFNRAPLWSDDHVSLFEILK